MTEPTLASDQSPPGATRPGGRTARTREAVRAATLAELAAKGFEGLSVDGVATRSGVHRTTVYRRWRNAAGLAADALELASVEPWPIPDTGSLAGDLQDLAELVVTHFTDQRAGAASRAIIAAALDDAATARALHSFLVRRHQQATPLAVRAVERGELPSDTDAEELIRATVAPLYYRLFVTGEPVDRSTAQRAAHAAQVAAQAGVFRRVGG